VELEVIEPVGLEDRTAEVLRLLEEQRANVLYVTGTCGVGKSTLAMRVGQVWAEHLGEPFWATDLGHAPEAFPLAQRVEQILGKSSPGAADSRGVLLLDNVDAAMASNGLLSGGPGVWPTAVVAGLNPPRLLIVTATPRTGSSRVQNWEVPPLGLPASPGGELSVLISDAGAVFLRAARHSAADWNVDERASLLVATLCRQAMGVPEALIELAELSARTPLEVLAAASPTQLAGFLDAAGSAYLRKVRRTFASMSDAVRELHVALSLLDSTVESEVGLALARALGGQSEGLLLWRDAVLAGVLTSTSVGGGLYFGMPQLVRAVAAEWLVDSKRSQQLRQVCGRLCVMSSSWQSERLLSSVDDSDSGLQHAGGRSEPGKSTRHRSQI
jgi:hypothetical protein